MMTTSDDQLDPLLDAWAQQHQLDQNDADAILYSVLLEPRPSLAPTWWGKLNEQVTAAVVLASSHANAPWAVPAEGTVPPARQWAMV